METEQPNYVNCCVRLETGLEAETLLGACLGIEAAMGKVRLYRNGPRNIDLDLLLYGEGDPQRPRPDPAPSAHAGTRFCADSPFGYLSRRPRPPALTFPPHFLSLTSRTCACFWNRPSGERSPSVKFKRIAVLLFDWFHRFVLRSARGRRLGAHWRGIRGEVPDELRVEFSLADCQSMFGAQGSLFYDAGHLEFQDAVSAQGDDWIISVEDLGGELRFFVYSQTMEKPLEGFAPLFIATFSLTEDTPASTPLEFSSQEVIVTDGETEAAAVDATFSVLSGETVHFHDVSSLPAADDSPASQENQGRGKSVALAAGCYPDCDGGRRFDRPLRLSFCKQERSKAVSPRREAIDGGIFFGFGLLSMYIWRILESK